MKKNLKTIIVIVVSLVILACTIFLVWHYFNKENNKNNGKAKTLNMKKEISTEEIKKYNEYLKISNEPNSEEWNSFFKEIKKEEFLDTNGEIKNVSNKAMSIETLDNSINLIGDYIKQIADVMQESPKMEAIDKNAENLINSLVEEQKVLTEIDDYFEKGDYKKDRLERVQELNDKYKVVLQNRQENNKIFSNSLRELAQAINKKMEEKLKKDKKITKLNILKFITSVNEFGEIAFGKNNLNFDEYELTKLEKASAKVKKEYRAISEMTLENAKKENITEADFNKIKSSSKILSENMEKMASGIKTQNIQVVVMSASNILNAQTDLESVYNFLILQK